LVANTQKKRLRLARNELDAKSVRLLMCEKKKKKRRRLQERRPALHCERERERRGGEPVVEHVQMTKRTERGAGRGKSKRVGRRKKDNEKRGEAKQAKEGRAGEEGKGGGVGRERGCCWLFIAAA